MAYSFIRQMPSCSHIYLSHCIGALGPLLREKSRGGFSLRVSSHGNGSHVSVRMRTRAFVPAHVCFATFSLLKGYTPTVGRQYRNAESVKKITVWRICSTVVRTLCFQRRGHGFDLWLRSYESTGHTAQPKKKKVSILSSSILLF